MKTYTPSITVSAEYIITNIDPNFVFAGKGLYKFEIVENNLTSCEYFGNITSISVMEFADIVSNYMTDQEDPVLFNQDAWSKQEQNHYSVGIPYEIEHKFFLVE